MAVGADPAAAAILHETAAAVREALGEDFGAIHIERAVLGLFFTGVKLSNGAGGICATPIKSIPQAVCCPSSVQAVPMPGKLRGRPAANFVHEMGPPDSLRRALAIATLSALCTTVTMRSGPPVGCAMTFGADGLEVVRIAEHDHVVVVGALGPIIKVLKARGRPFTILERDQTTLKPDELPFFVPAEAAAQEISRADVVVTTGTTLINDTLEGLLASARPGTEIAVVGPTASLLPDAFFRRGVRVLGGVAVTAPDKLLDVLAEGGSGYHFFGRSAERVVLQSV